MNVGAVLVGVSLAAMAVSYVVRPFRGGSSLTVEDSIEAWVAASRGETVRAPGRCPRCGRRTARGDRFCPGCGAPLGREG